MNRTHLVSSLAWIWIGLCVLSCEDRCSCPAPTPVCGDDWQPVAYPAPTYGRISVSQGVSGDVWYWEGNFMPWCPTGTVRAVSRELRVYEQATDGDVTWTTHAGHSFIESVRTPLVATAHSDSTGFFQLSLPAGDYSMFSVEDSLLFGGDREDLDGHLSPIDVGPGEVVQFRFDIDYKKAM